MLSAPGPPSSRPSPLPPLRTSAPPVAISVHVITPKELTSPAPLVGVNAVPAVQEALARPGGDLVVVVGAVEEAGDEAVLTADGARAGDRVRAGPAGRRQVAALSTIDRVGPGAALDVVVPRA